MSGTSWSCYPAPNFVALAALYACFFGGLGLLQPLLPLYLSEHGMPAHLTTRVLAVGALAAVLVPPAVGLIADAFRARALILRGAMLLCSLSLLAFLRVPSGVTALIIVAVMYSIVRAPIPTLVDAVALATTTTRGGSYGQLRLFGSIGFLVAVLAAGELIHAYGWDALLVATSLAFALACAAACLLHVHPRASTQLEVPWLRLLERRELWLFLAIVAIAQMGASAYDACYALHMKELGYSPRFTSFAWGLGVLAEVCVLVGSGRLLRRWSPERLLAIAFATAAVRWLLLAHVTSASSILALQLLHGITFPLYWVPAVMIVSKAAPRELATAAQGLLSAAAGVGGVIGMMLSGTALETGGGTRVYSYAAIAAAVATLGAVRFARQTAARSTEASIDLEPVELPQR